MARRQPTKSDLGKACEFFVRGNLLARGLKVTYPDNVNGSHDVHARIGRRWYTIQVESAQRRHAVLSSRKVRANVKSDILALVHIPTQQLRYISRRRGVPRELATSLCP